MWFLSYVLGFQPGRGSRSVTWRNVSVAVGVFGTQITVAIRLSAASRHSRCPKINLHFLKVSNLVVHGNKLSHVFFVSDSLSIRDMSYQRTLLLGVVVSNVISRRF